jgi:DNA-binding response OmpR family regulator
VILDAFRGVVPRKPIVRGIALDLGCLGYLTRRFEFSDLEARVKLFERRYNGVRK